MEKTINSTVQENRTKQTYIAPDIICIEIDSSISLAMESNPPTGDGENTSMNFHSEKDPFYTVYT